jgi:hypothetical protein
VLLPNFYDATTQPIPKSVFVDASEIDHFVRCKRAIATFALQAVDRRLVEHCSLE